MINLYQSFIWTHAAKKSDHIGELPTTHRKKNPPLGASLSGQAGDEIRLQTQWSTGWLGESLAYFSPIISSTRHQCRKGTIVQKQLLRWSKFNDLTFVHHCQLVVINDRLQTMRNTNHCAVCTGGTHRLLHFWVCVHVHICSALVQEDNSLMCH